MKHRVCAEQLFYQLDRISSSSSLRILHVTVNIVRFALFYVSYNWLPFSVTLLHLLSQPLSTSFNRLLGSFVLSILSCPLPPPGDMSTPILRRQLSYAQFVSVCTCVCVYALLVVRPMHVSTLRCANDVSLTLQPRHRQFLFLSASSSPFSLLLFYTGV